MLVGSVSTMVDAAPEHIWQVMLDKIETPTLNLPAPSEIKVLQRHSDYLLRERFVDSERILERVTVDNAARKITYTLLGHPNFEGYISHQLLRSDNTTMPGCILAFAVDIKLKHDDMSEEECPDLFELANDDLFLLKELIESGYGKSATPDQEDVDIDVSSMFEA
jgi:hypothetical protein